MGFARPDKSILGSLVPPALRPGAIVEVLGPASAGKIKLGHSWVARVLRGGGRVAWVDGPGTFYGPSAAADGVPLDNLLIVRPNPAQLTRACRILVASSVYVAVVLDIGPQNLSVLSPTVARKLWHLARKSRTCVYVLVTGEQSLFAERAGVRLRHNSTSPRKREFVVDRVRSVDAPTLLPGARLVTPVTTVVEPAWYTQMPDPKWDE